MGSRGQIIVLLGGVIFLPLALLTITLLYQASFIDNSDINAPRSSRELWAT